MHRFSHELRPEHIGRGVGGGDVLHWIFTLAFLALVVILAVWLIQNMRRPAMVGGPASRPLPPRPMSSVETALAEARMRYARGEMTREQFLQINADLGGAPPEQPPTYEPPEQQA